MHLESQFLLDTATCVTLKWTHLKLKGISALLLHGLCTHSHSERPAGDQDTEISGLELVLWMSAKSKSDRKADTILPAVLEG